MFKDSCVTALYALDHCDVTKIKDVRNRKLELEASVTFLSKFCSILILRF